MDNIAYEFPVVARIDHALAALDLADGGGHTAGLHLGDPDPLEAFDDCAKKPVNVRTIPNQYQYEPLENPWQIRVLFLFPGMDDMPVRCSLIKTQLRRPGTSNSADTEDEPSQKYEALSYCWGNMDAVSEISVDGKAFNVTTDLYHTLRRLRPPPSSTLMTEEQHPGIIVGRILWIDAICIDQHNIAERTAQVNIMSHIYYQSYHTLIDVGEGDDDSDFIMGNADLFVKVTELVTKIGPHELIGSRLRTVVSSGDWHPIKRVFESAVQFDTQKRLTTAIRFKFLCLPWLRRVWVLQEVCKSPSMPIFRWGSQTVSWGAMIILAIWSEDWALRHLAPIIEQQECSVESKLLQLSTLGLPKLWITTATLLIPNQLLPILFIFLYGHEFRATDDRDKLFALLGLASEVESMDDGDNLRLYPGLRADYRRSTPATFAEFTQDFIRRTKSLDILAAAGRFDWGARKGNPPGCPSWTPTLSGAGQAPRTRILGSIAGVHKCAGETKPQLQESPHPGILRLMGYYPVCGEICHVPSTTDRATGKKHTLPFVNIGSDFLGFGCDPEERDGLKWIWDNVITRHDGGTGHRSCDLDALFSSFLDTLTGGVLDIETSEPRIEQEYDDNIERSRMLQALAAYWEKVDPSYQSLPPMWRDRLQPMRPSSDQGQWRRLITYMALASGRCFAITGDGLMCLCPPGTMVGDVVAVFLGGSTPFLIRPLPSTRQLPFSLIRPRRYEFIGESYVHGLMKGEFIDKAMEIGLPPMVIDLC